jgi:S1-C subfamily serine protease
VHSANQLIALIQKNKPGDQISLTISRGGSTKTVSVTLGSN